LAGQAAIGRRTAAVVLALAALAAPASARGVPADFFGVVPQAPLSVRDFERMDGVVGSLRITVNWAQSEPQRGVFDFSQSDEAIGRAADRGIDVLPVMAGIPPWLEENPSGPPISSPPARRAWAAFLRHAVDRYGPGGSFWDGRRHRQPIRLWQVWNEPNYLVYWRPRPSPDGYARLLRVAANAIRSRDPRAHIVLAGVAPVGAGLAPTEFLRRLYRVPGARGDFDVVALHPYASTVARMRDLILRVRRIMIAAGDVDKPLLISELGVASTGPASSTFIRGAAGQASFLREAFELLAVERRHWRIAGVDWFTWQDSAGGDPYCVFCQGAGLFDLDGRAKPAWAAFKRTVASTSVR
jgi:hypothetical protein